MSHWCRKGLETGKPKSFRQCDLYYLTKVYQKSWEGEVTQQRFLELSYSATKLDAVSFKSQFHIHLSKIYRTLSKIKIQNNLSYFCPLLYVFFRYFSILVLQGLTSIGQINEISQTLKRSSLHTLSKQKSSHNVCQR